jgi:hypothetical protein
MLLAHRWRVASVADDWGERLGWTFDLACDEPARRRLAHRRLVETRKRWTAALRSYNEVWNKRDHPEYRLRLDAYSRAFDFTYPHALWRRRTVPLAQWEGLPYAVLYLRWEATFPDEWTAFRSGWGTKKGTLRDLAAATKELPQPVLDELEDLVMMAVHRQYRCEDVGYARVARSIDSPRLRDRLAAAARSADATSRLHSAYLLWLIENPSVPQPKIRQWKTWLLHRTLAASPETGGQQLSGRHQVDPTA